MTKRKILTVVLLSGCGTTAASQKSTPGPAPVARAAQLPVTQVAGVAHVASPPVVAVAATTPPPVLQDELQPSERLELRAELYNTDPLMIGTQMERFRALCDADGYPLVGNVSGKKMNYAVATYCENVQASQHNDV